MSRIAIKAVVIALALTVAIVYVFLDSKPVDWLRALWPNVMSQFQSPADTLPYPPPPAEHHWKTMSPAQRLDDLHSRAQPHLEAALARDGVPLGSAVFIRAFKESNEMEIWLRPDSTARDRAAYRLWKTCRIAAFSGFLGPKLKEGDLQAPEGFYSVTKNQLNPASQYHLAFNIGYPNEYDRFHERTGSLIMVHGSKVSVGCFAMTDPVIEEIYLIVEAALDNGQPGVPVHVFPFRMSTERMSRAIAERSPWIEFWQNVKEGHDWFESNRTPPTVQVRDGRYAFAK